MDLDKKLESIVSSRYAEYESGRGSMLNTLKRHARAIARELGSDKFHRDALLTAGAGAAGALAGYVVAGAAVPAVIAAAGIVTAVGGMAIGVAGLAGGVAHLLSRGVKPNAEDWAGDMKKLDDLMLKAQFKTPAGPQHQERWDLGDPDKLRELARCSWFERKLSPYPKEVFAVADQMAKIEQTSYQGVTRNLDSAPTEQIRSAISTWQDRPEKYQQQEARNDVIQLGYSRPSLAI